MSVRKPHVQGQCEVCGAPTWFRGKTGCCQRCLREGAAFARSWARDLRAAGLSWPRIGDLLGASANAIQVAVNRDRRRSEEAA